MTVSMEHGTTVSMEHGTTVILPELIFGTTRKNSRFVKMILQANNMLSMDGIQLQPVEQK